MLTCNQKKIDGTTDDINMVKLLVLLKVFRSPPGTLSNHARKVFLGSRLWCVVIYYALVFES